MIARLLAILLAASLWALPASAQFADQQTWGGTGGGSANAQTVTLANVGALADLLGVEVRFTPNATNSAATTLAVGGTAATAMRKWSPAGLIALTGGELRTGVPVSVMYNGTFHVLLSPTMVQPVPTRQIFTSGSGTYTVTTSGGQTPRQLRVEVIGGGGEGGGVSGGGNGNAGALSSFNSIEAAGGSGGPNGGTGGAGGTGGGGTCTPPNCMRWDGTPGAAGATTQNNILGGQGGTSACRGGGAGGQINAAGRNAPANTGGGGSGAGGATGNVGPGGGGAQCYLLIIDNPSSTYPYAVGAGGAGGSGTAGDGAPGIIIVDEIYLRPPANDNELMGECRCAA